MDVDTDVSGLLAVDPDDLCVDCDPGFDAEADGAVDGFVLDGDVS